MVGSVGFAEDVGGVMLKSGAGFPGLPLGTLGVTSDGAMLNKGAG